MNFQNPPLATDLFFLYKTWVSFSAFIYTRLVILIMKIVLLFKSSVWGTKITFLVSKYYENWGCVIITHIVACCWGGRNSMKKIQIGKRGRNEKLYANQCQEMFYRRANSDKKCIGPSGFDRHPRDLGNFCISLYLVRVFTTRANSSVIFARTVINTLTDACLFNAAGFPSTPLSRLFLFHIPTYWFIMQTWYVRLSGDPSCFTIVRHRARSPIYLPISPTVWIQFRYSV